MRADLAIPDFLTCLPRGQSAPEAIPTRRDADEAEGDVYLLHLNDDLPRFGSGYRLVVVTRESRGHVSIRAKNGVARQRLPRSKWDGLSKKLIKTCPPGARSTRGHDSSNDERKKTMTTMPNFAEMTGAQLLEQFNALQAKFDPEAKPRRSKIEPRTRAIEVVEDLWKRVNAAPKPAKKTTKGGSRREALEIKMVTKANPRREGTGAHAHWEVFAKSQTVGDYLSHYPAEDKKGRRDANLYLYFAVKEGHVELVDPDQKND